MHNSVQSHACEERVGGFSFSVKAFGIGAACIVLALFSRSLLTRATVDRLSAARCQGTFEQAYRAQGDPEVKADGTSADFHEFNSAVLEGASGDLQCDAFTRTDRLFTRAELVFVLGIRKASAPQPLPVSSAMLPETASVAPTASSTELVAVSSIPASSSPIEVSGATILPLASQPPEASLEASPSPSQTSATSSEVSAVTGGLRRLFSIWLPAYADEISELPAASATLLPEAPSAINFAEELPMPESSPSPDPLQVFEQSASASQPLFATGIPSVIAQDGGTTAAPASMPSIPPAGSPAPSMPVDAGVAFVDALVDLSYSLDGVHWQVLGQITPDEATAQRSYWRYALPEGMSTTTLANLRVRVQARMPEASGVTVYVDSIFAEVAYLDDSQKTEPFAVSADALDFDADDIPVFYLAERASEGLVPELAALLGFVPNLSDVRGVSVTISSRDGTAFTVPVAMTREGSRMRLELDTASLRKHHSGKYTLAASVDVGGAEVLLQKDFTWGVLALNTDSTVYRSGAQARIDMAVLDDAGHVVCDAALTLAIVDPAGATTVKSTADGSIAANPACRDKSFTLIPDYAAAYAIGSAKGTYALQLTAVTASGRRTVRDVFSVEAEPAFEVFRAGPTRIYPPAEYEMRLTMRPREDFTGTVRELVPSSFTVHAQPENPAFSAQPHVADQSRTALTWEVDWKAGQTYVLGYVFDAPDISPEFYLLGPLEIGTPPSGVIASPSRNEDEAIPPHNNEIASLPEAPRNDRLNRTDTPLVASDQEEAARASIAVLNEHANTAKTRGAYFTETRSWQIAADAITNIGVAFYANKTTVGKLQISVNTSLPSTFGGNINTAIGDTVSQMYWVVAKPNPAKDEYIIGGLHANGRLDVMRCTGTCRQASDYTLAWSVTSVSAGTQVCDGSPVSTENCVRPFDIAYEQLTGRAVVVYARNPPGGPPATANDYTNLFYCIWNGTSWSPQSSCSPVVGSNSISLNGITTTTVRWLALKGQGEQMNDGRSNKLFLSFADGGNATVASVGAGIWSGSAWTNTTRITGNATDLCNVSQCMDGDWSGVTGTAVVVYGNDSATGPLVGQEFNAVTGWDINNRASSVALLSQPRWVKTRADANSNRVGIASLSTGADFRPLVWKFNNVTPNFTSGNVDGTAESALGAHQDVAWEKLVSRQEATSYAVFIYSDSNCWNPGYETWSSATGFSAAIANVESAGCFASIGDDQSNQKLYASANNDTLRMLSGDIDSTLKTYHYSKAWNGTAAQPGTEAALSGDVTTNNNRPNEPFSFGFDTHAPWSMNWQWFDDETNTKPTDVIAATNAAAVIVQGDTMRLRFQISEKRGTAETQSRKKLQYAATVDPDSATTTWTNVDEVGGIGLFTYDTPTCSPTACSDGTALSASSLTVTSGQGKELGTFITSGTAASGANMNVSATSTVEYDFIVKENGAALGTAYYFRMYDVESRIPVYRDQRSGQTPCYNSTVCTYPSLTVDTVKLFQEDFIFENDSASSVNENTNPVSASTSRTNVEKGERFTVRFLLNNASAAGGATSSIYQVQYDRNFSSVWLPVTSGEISVQRGISGTSVSQLTSQRTAAACSGGSAFNADGRWYENSASSASYLLADAACTELAWIFSTATAVAGTTYRLRLYNWQAGKALSGYSATPTITIVNPQNKKFSKTGTAEGEKFSVPAVSDDMPYYLDATGYSAVALDDGAYDTATSFQANGIPVSIFKIRNTNADSAQVATITWNGHSNVAPSTNNVFLDVWNSDSQSWLTASTNNWSAANTDFTFTSVTSGTALYDALSFIYVRVRQAAGAEALRTDVVSATFANKNVLLTQRAAIFENDNGNTPDTNTITASGSPALTVEKGQRFALRFQIDNAGNAPTTTKFHVQYDRSDNNWRSVSSGEISVQPGISGTDGDSLSASNAGACQGVASFVNGTWHEQTATTGSFYIDRSRCTEFAFMLSTATATPATTYRFRLVNGANNNQTLNSAATPTITIVSPQTKKYSKTGLGAERAVSPAAADDLAYYADATGYAAVLTDDGLYDTATSTGSNVPVSLFKIRNANLNNTDAITLSWNGQSNVAASANAISIDLWNTTLATWITASTNILTAANTDFTFSTATASPSFYDANFFVYLRVKQAAGAEALRTDYISAAFTTALPVLTQRAALFENDNGQTVDTNTIATTSLLVAEKGQRFAVRFQVDNTGTAVTSTQYRVQYDHNDNNWKTVTSGELSVQYGASGLNGDALSVQKAGTCVVPNAFTNGRWHENTSTSNSFTLDTRDCSELAWMLSTATATPGTTYRLRLYNETAQKILNGYTATPTIVISSPASKNYSKTGASPGEPLSAPALANDLLYYLDATGYSAVALQDAVYDAATSSQASSPPISLFKVRDPNQSNLDIVTVTWRGKSNVAASAKSVTFDIWNNVSSSWITASTNAFTAANTDFTFSTVTSSANFYDANYAVYVRVKQAAGVEALNTDYVSLAFAGPQYTPKTQNWRWYDDETNEMPSSPLGGAGENVAPANVAYDNIVKLRITVKETANTASVDTKFRLEFSEYSDFSTATASVASTSTCASTSYWCYADGGGSDNAVVTSKVLSDADACAGGVGNGCGTHNESATSVSVFDQPASAATEFEFTLRHAGARANTVYFFRVYNDTSATAVPFTAGKSYPSLSTEGAALIFTVAGLPSGTVTEGITTDIGTTAATVPFGSLPVGSGAEAAQRFTVTTNATQGYKIFVYETQGLAGQNEILPVDGTNESPAAWAIPGGADGAYGYHAGDDALEGGSVRFAADNTYAKFTTSSKEVAFSSVPVTNETTDLIFKAEITNLQQAGQYENAVAYIAVPVF